MGQQGDVPVPVAERRQHDGDDVDPVVQVLAELAARDRLAQVSVRRRHDAHVHVDQRGRAHAPHLSLLDGAQQLRLQRGRDVADLVEEERAPVGRLDQSGLGPDGTRERALLVTEQLGLEQRLGKRRAIDGHERAGDAGAVRVDGASDQLLAGPRLAADEDVGVGPRRLLHQLERARHGRAAPDHVLEAERRLQLVPEVPVLDLEVPLTQGPLDGDLELVDGEGLGKVVERAFLHRRHRRLDARERRDHDHGQGGVDVVRPPQQLDAVHSRHLEVGQQQVRGIGLDERQRAMGIRRRQASMAGAPQDARAVLDHVGLVVDDDDRRVAHAVTRRAIGGMAGLYRVAPGPPPARTRRLSEILERRMTTSLVPEDADLRHLPAVVSAA